MKQHPSWALRIGMSLSAYLCLSFWSVTWSQLLPSEPRSCGSVAPTMRFANGSEPHIHSPPDYWIVSSRHCKDQLELGQPCSFDVYRVDGLTGRESSLEELYASLSPGIPVCFMVHGSFVVWESMLVDSAGTFRWLRGAAPERPLQLVFFTWPSDNPTKMVPTVINIREARIMGRRAELNSLYLAQLVSRVPESNPTCLIGHSHGARMVSATLHLLSGGAIEGRYAEADLNGRQRIRSVLAAAALDHDWFNPGERYELALCRSEITMNLRNRHDLPLIFHPTHQLCAARALGRAGVTTRDRSMLGTGSYRIMDYDVTALIGCKHYWPNYYRHPEIAQAIRHCVYFDE